MAKKYLVINKTTDEIEMIADDEDSAYTFIKLSCLNFEDFSIEKIEMKYFGKSIIISIRPEWVCKILNGEKTIEVRKKFPKDYVGWVYIYCTKSSNCCLLSKIEDNGGLTENRTYREYQTYGIITKRLLNNFGLECGEHNLSGKVVAKFWCDKVDYYVNGHKWSSKAGAPMWGASNDYEYILKDACLNDDELRLYCDDLCFMAIHITRLRIFTKPMELTMFRKVGFRKAQMENGKNKERQSLYELLRDWALTKAPQSWQYIEDC